MARYSEPKQKRSITKQYGLFVVKTPDMCTYHKTFVDAVESYSNVYRTLPLAGVLESELENRSLEICKEIQKLKDHAEQTYAKMEKTYIQMSETFEKSSRTFEEVVSQSRTVVKASRELRQRVRNRRKHMESYMTGQSKNEEAA